MRLQDKRSFKAINFDDADEYLENGDTRNMLNVRVGYSENGDDGIITNVKGTVSLFSTLGFSLPSGLNKCVGTCTDDQNNRLIWFNYNPNGNHGIYCYNSDTNAIQTVLESSTLNFSGEIIHSIDILNGELAWVDENRPRAINVAAGIAGTYAGATIEELINDAKLVPMFPPECTPVLTNGPDYIKTLRSFQFIYRYVFIGGEKGAFGTVSKLIPTAFKDEHVSKITLDVSACEIFTKTAIRPVVDYIEFAVRELYTFNFNQFLRISTADLVAAGGIIDYFDTESKTPLDLTDTNRAFYENPIKAESVAFQNDRKFYATCTEGYDAFGLSTINVSTEIIPESGSIPYLSDCGTHANERYLKPDSVYGYSAEWHDEYGRKSGAIDLPELVIKTAPQTSNDYKANVLNFDVNLASAGTYPEWAEKFEILRSDNQSVTFFVQGRVNNVKYCNGYDVNGDPTYVNASAGVGNLNVSDTGAIELHIDISNWSLYGINIGYTWSEGDRLTVFTIGGTADTAGFDVFKGLKIKELRGSLLIVDYPPLVGISGLNHAQIGLTILDAPGPGFDVLNLSRFIVGDNGVLVYSRAQQTETGSGTGIFPGFPFPYTGIAKATGFPEITNNLYGVSLIYTDTGSQSDSIGLYIVGSEGYFIKGSYTPYLDSFGSWTVISTGITTDINAIENSFDRHAGADLIMVGQGGVILKYNVAGNSITAQTSGVTENLNYVYRTGTGSTLIAVGDDGVILRTTNNGSTWTRITIDNCQDIHSVYSTGSYSVAVGDEGLVLLSGDGGVTWAQRTIGTASNLYSVEGDGATANTVYIAGENGYLALFSLTLASITTQYNSLTTKNINFFQTYDVPNTGDNMGILIGDLDLLKDVNIPSQTFTDYSGNVSALFGSVYLNYKAKIEVYSPKTTAGPVLYYEVGDAFPVGANYSFSKGKNNDGDVFLLKKDFQGTGWTSKGDLVFSMTPDVNNTSGTWDKDLGRPNTVLLYPELQQKRNIIRYSDRYVQDSKINGLSSFQEVNYEVIPNEFGWVRKITPMETILLINAEREAATAHIDQTMFTQSNGQQVAAISDKVINNIRKLIGGFGCTNPESITHYLGQIYWYSSNKSAVCRYNNYNGVFPISEYKARTYFNSLDKNQFVGGFEPNYKNYLITSGGTGRELIINGNFATPSAGWINVATSALITGLAGSLNLQPYTVSGVDQGDILTVGKYYRLVFTVVSADGGNALVILNCNSNYTVQDVITVVDSPASNNTVFTIDFTATQTVLNFLLINNTSFIIDSVSVKEIRPRETIAFHEPSNRWISKYSFTPEQYGHVSNELFSFKDGTLWKHNASNTYNNFYGTQFVSQVNPIFNVEPSYQKNFGSIALEADKVWSASAMTTKEGQHTFILSGHFEQINKEWWADVKQDINTPNMPSMYEALFNGDFMQSNTLNVILESSLSDQVSLRFANLYSNINQRTNK
jgi:hypothetical protein